MIHTIVFRDHSFKLYLMDTQTKIALQIKN